MTTTRAAIETSETIAPITPPVRLFRDVVCSDCAAFTEDEVKASTASA